VYTGIKIKSAKSADKSMSINFDWNIVHKLNFRGVFLHYAFLTLKLIGNGALSNQNKSSERTAPKLRQI
jgi:hypothetical protein